MNTQLLVIFSSLVILGCCYPLTIILIINYYFLFNRLLKLDIGTSHLLLSLLLLLLLLLLLKGTLKENFSL